MRPFDQIPTAWKWQIQWRLDLDAGATKNIPQSFLAVPIRCESHCERIPHTITTSLGWWFQKTQEKRSLPIRPTRVLENLKNMSCAQSIWSSLRKSHACHSDLTRMVVQNVYVYMYISQCSWHQFLRIWKIWLLPIRSDSPGCCERIPKATRTLLERLWTKQEPKL